MASVAKWYRVRNGIEKEAEEQEEEEVPEVAAVVTSATPNSRESGFPPPRPTRKFDVMGMPGLHQLVMDEDDCLGQEPLTVEWENADLDVKADYYCSA